MNLWPFSTPPGKRFIFFPLITPFQKMNLLPGGVENGRCHVCFKFTTGSSRTCRTPPRAVLLHADPAIMGLLRVPGSWIWSLRFTATSMAAWKWNPICSSNETLGEWRRVIPNRQFPNRRMEIGPFFEFFFSALGATKTAIFCLCFRGAGEVLLQLLVPRWRWDLTLRRPKKLWPKKSAVVLSSDSSI